MLDVDRQPDWEDPFTGVARTQNPQPQGADMKLYDIADNYRNIAELLEDPDLAENQTILAALDAVTDDFNHKAVQVVRAIKNTEHRVAAIDAEIKRLQAMKKTAQNKLDSVRDYLKFNMRESGIHKITCPLFSITYSERRQSAVEIDEDVFLANNVDEDLVTVKITPNKTAIKTAIARGDNVIGAKLVDSQVLAIK